jgi:hypothetical protein
VVFVYCCHPTETRGLNICLPDHGVEDSHARIYCEIAAASGNR